MDKKAIECRINAPKIKKQLTNCESALLKAEKHVYNDSLLVGEKVKEINVLSDSVAVQRETIKTKNSQIKKQKFLKWLFGGIGAAGTVYFAVKP